MKKNLYDIFANAWLKECEAIYIISDTHFGDFDAYNFKGLLNLPVDTFFANEDFREDIKKLDEEQIKKINSKAGKNSCLIILGDIGDIECIKKLKAKYKVLIRGNHDKGVSNYKKAYSEEFKYTGQYNEDTEAYNQMKQSGWTIENEHYYENNGDSLIIDAVLWKRTIDNNLFDEIYEGPLMINDRCILSHEPIEVPEYMFNIHGHVHNLRYWKETLDDGHHMNVVTEAIDYEPINLSKLLRSGLLSDIASIHRTVIDRRLRILYNKKKRQQHENEISKTKILL